jgi:hypothetical protein
MPVCIMATKCRSRTVVVVDSVLYTTPGDGIQTTGAKLIYRTLLACLRNIWSFGSKMTIKDYKVNAKLGVAERLIA